MKLLPLDSAERIELAAGWLSEPDNFKWLDFGNGIQKVTPVTLKIMTQRDLHVFRLYTADDGDLPVGIGGLSNVDRNFKNSSLWAVLGRTRYGREALYLPSGRAALYLAFREWLRPGDRLLMSPVTDDVVFFVVLAAGLVPVIGPIDPRTGNLAPTAIEDSAWPTLRAVLTTNLYGIPDRMDLLEERCRQHDLVLLEDAAHAIDSRCEERRIGQFGVAAAYSLHKHLEVE